MPKYDFILPQVELPDQETADELAERIRAVVAPLLRRTKEEVQLRIEEAPGGILNYPHP